MMSTVTLSLSLSRNFTAIERQTHIGLLRPTTTWLDPGWSPESGNRCLEARWSWPDVSGTAHSDLWRLRRPGTSSAAWTCTRTRRPASAWRSWRPRRRRWQTCAARVAWPTSCCRTSGKRPCPRCTWKRPSEIKDHIGNELATAVKGLILRWPKALSNSDN